jgi:hypothetical protein
MSMTPDKQLVPLAHGKLDPLKSKIMSQVDSFSETKGEKKTGERVLNVINACTDESKSTNWVQCVKDLKKLEKSQSLSKPLTSSIVALSALNLIWLGYPFVNKLLGAEQICFLEELDGMIPPLVIANYVAFAVSLVMLSSATSCCRPSEHLTKKLRAHIKEQASLGNDVKVEGLKPIIAQFPRKNTSMQGQFLEAAKFAELPDGSVDVAQFKKVFPRSYGLDSDELRYILAFSFLANTIPSVLCGPGINSEWGALWAAPGYFMALINALSGAGNLMGGYAGAKKQVSTDIRSVINLIQDHLDEQRASDDMV